MSIPFIDRDPLPKEVERFRLILSTYQDGSGQQAFESGQTLPGWRDFERSVALAFCGIASENKYIFDVLIPDPDRDAIYYGISCKMRRTLNETKRLGRVTLELSNSSGKFWDKLNQNGLSQQNYKDKPFDVAQSLLTQENEWHHAVGLEKDGDVDLTKSFYLALSWNKQGEYQLFKFSLDLPIPSSLKWDFPLVKKKTRDEVSRRLRGQDEQGTLFEWYGESGGQLKYYPLVDKALWKSDIFQLEALPEDWNLKHGILAKAQDYFCKQWESLK